MLPRMFLYICMFAAVIFLFSACEDGWYSDEMPCDKEEYIGLCPQLANAKALALDSEGIYRNADSPCFLQRIWANAGCTTTSLCVQIEKILSDNGWTKKGEGRYAKIDRSDKTQAHLVMLRISPIDNRSVLMGWAYVGGDNLSDVEFDKKESGLSGFFGDMNFVIDIFWPLYEEKLSEQKAKSTKVR